MRKNIIMLSVVIMLIASCGPPLKEDGSFGNEKFVGKFHGVSIYGVTTPGGTNLYIGVNEDGKIVTTQYSTGGKTPTTHRVIIIDGKKVTEEEARKLITPN